MSTFLFLDTRHDLLQFLRRREGDSVPASGPLQDPDGPVVVALDDQPSRGFVHEAEGKKGIVLRDESGKVVFRDEREEKFRY